MAKSKPSSRSISKSSLCSYNLHRHIYLQAIFCIGPSQQGIGGCCLPPPSSTLRLEHLIWIFTSREQSLSTSSILSDSEFRKERTFGFYHPSIIFPLVKSKQQRF